LSHGSGRADRRVLAYTDSRIYSGAEALFAAVVRGLADRPAYELRCAAPATNRVLSDALREASGRGPLDVPAQPLPLAALHLLDPRRRRGASRAMSEWKPDVLLVNLPSAEYGATPLLARPEGVSAVGILHVPGSPRRLGFRLGRLRERLARRALGGLDAVCVLTESAARTYEELWAGDGTRIRTINLPRPHLDRLDRDEARNALGLPPGPIVGIAGRVSVKQKGHDTFVAAAAALAGRRPDVAFAVAGAGRDAGRVEEMVRQRGLEDRFHLLGHVQPIGTFLSAIDAIAVPSRFEGLPLIALEALELGVPGVAASTDGLRDVWPADWRVPADDPDALAEALQRVLATPEEDLRRRLEEGRGMARRNTSEDVAADVGEVLEEVVRAG
jgi:glycosyltransferase involved in cell wall biosynthesis